ncbi:Zinc finger, C3HC4 type (RING finger) protein [Rhizoctonia solani]|uniref:Zinc finger, C3HC4 type (RING finger) protein n=2 Tax=Rhizoctonia solani TaxID=456999 RepID=A0A8H8NT16_9AGAM|nr:Zinc finger, C3HC4 type (RING finger) protein [Rhizoctonia solani]QRW18258.1 Zinc finger, C3HC4 type (RING finger) protein [Rhizoctonia solani]
MAESKNQGGVSDSRSEELFRQLVTCGICLQLYVDPVALLDCLHLACGSCAKQWLKSSELCHQCRGPVRGVHDSHHTLAVVEAYQSVAPNSGLCQERTPEITSVLRSQYKPGQQFNIGGGDEVNSDGSPSELPDTEYEGEESYESSQAYSGEIQLLQDLFREILAFRGSSLPKASWHGNTNGGANPSHVNADDTVCTSCALDLVEASVFEWWLSKRQSTTATVELSEDIMTREDCWYGIECRTARHNEQHARSYNHICRNTVANQLTEHDDLPENGNRYVTESTNLYANFPAFSPSAIMFRDKGKEPSFMCSSVRPTRSGIDIIPGKLTIWGPYLGVQVYYGERGREYLQSGQVQLLMDTKSMRWVQTSRGIVPEDCRPVVGGRRTDAGRSRLLFHCAVWWRGQRIPGYTSTDAEYATITWDGQEWYFKDNYEILCWN